MESGSFLNPIETKNNIVYRYNQDTFLYEGSVALSTDPITNQLNQVIYTTETKPPFENLQEYQQFYYDVNNNVWLLKDIEISGIYFDIINGEKKEKILQKDIQSYTTTEPTLEILEGDKISFNTQTQKWFYSKQGNLRILQNAKQDKLNILNAKYQKSKTVHVNNGNSFVLQPNDKYYQQFRNTIEITTNATQRNDFNKTTFFCIQDGYKYTVTLMNYVWRKVFYPTQQNRLKNKEKYEVYLYKIENTNSIQELEIINIDFDFADGYVVDVNAITQNFIQEINEGKHPVEVVNEMQNFLAKQTTEHIELIQKIKI